MRVFISFAAEQQIEAEQIAYAIRGRGHSVFFSTHQIRSSERFDSIIESEIGKADFLVFLISPDSVKRGRYTRTEIDLFQKKWSHPVGRAVPVVVVDTPIQDVPAFLRSVSLLQPKGDVAAETAARVDELSGRIDVQAIAIFFVIGIGTGLASYVALLHWGILAFYGIWWGGKISYAPGLIFAILVAFCVRRFGTRDAFSLGVVFGFTFVAYVATPETFAFIYKNFVMPRTRPPVTLQELFDPRMTTLALIMSYAAAGVVYSALTAFAVALVNQAFRRLDVVLPIIAAGTVAGCVLYIREINDDLGFLLAFVTFHSTVIALIARGLSKPLKR